VAGKRRAESPPDSVRIRGAPSGSRQSCCFPDGSPVGQSGFIALSRPVAFMLALCAIRQIRRSSGGKTWSMDGRVIYYTSECDGFPRIWGSSSSRPPARSSGAVRTYHSHRPRLAMKELPLGPFDIWVTNPSLRRSLVVRFGPLGTAEHFIQSGPCAPCPLRSRAVALSRSRS